MLVIRSIPLVIVVNRACHTFQVNPHKFRAVFRVDDIRFYNLSLKPVVHRVEDSFWRVINDHFLRPVDSGRDDGIRHLAVLILRTVGDFIINLATSGQSEAKEGGGECFLNFVHIKATY